jgi:hypothetical protein
VSEVKTHLALEGDDLIVNRVQDVEPIMDWAKMLAEQPQHGRDFHHKWSLPAVMVEKFYNDYCGVEYKPMNQEFWEWVHKKMQDPQYKKFWTYDTANPFHVGYGDGAR